MGRATALSPMVYKSNARGTSSNWRLFEGDSAADEKARLHTKNNALKSTILISQLMALVKVLPASAWEARLHIDGRLCLKAEIYVCGNYHSMPNRKFKAEKFFEYS